jgi:hypothetical protein
MMGMKWRAGTWRAGRWAVRNWVGNWGRKWERSWEATIIILGVLLVFVATTAVNFITISFLKVGQKALFTCE